MTRNNDKSTGSFGLLANGTSGGWSIDVDQSSDADEWWLELDGPSVRLGFRLHDLSIPREALRFLEAGLADRGGPGVHGPATDQTLSLGRFGAASVELRRDREDFPRYFLVVNAEDQSNLFVNLFGEDLQQVTQALRDVMGDLPEGVAR